MAAFLKRGLSLFFLALHFSCFVNEARAALTDEIKDKFQKEIDLLGIDGVQAVLRVMKAVRDTDAPSVCNGRLTLTSGTVVTTADVTAATTVYFAPFQGNAISLYDGSRWQIITFSEKSVAVPSTTVTPFDVFGYNSSGTLTLETVNWTNDTTRATALATQNGVLVKSGTATRRYLGTARTTGSSGQTEDSNAKRYLWNMCNRVPRKLLAQSTTDSWDYTTATWRAANGSSTNGVTEVEFVLGQQIEPVKLAVLVPKVLNSTGQVDVSAGIGIDSTSSNSANVYGGKAHTVGTSTFASYTGFPGVGYHYGQWLEIAQASNTTTWYTDLQSGGSQRMGGLRGEIWN